MKYEIIKIENSYHIKMSINKNDILSDYISSYASLIAQTEFILESLEKNYVPKLEKFRRMNLEKKDPLNIPISDIDFGFLGYVRADLTYELFFPVDHPFYDKINKILEETVNDENLHSAIKNHPRYFIYHADKLFFIPASDSFTLMSNRWYQVKNMFVVYLFALFEGYIKHLFNQIMLFRPDLMKSDKKISHKEIIEAKNIDDIYEIIAKSKLDVLSNKLIDEIKDLLKNVLGFSDSDINEYLKWEYLEKWRGIRNLIVHNNGKISEEHILKYPEYQALKDSAIQIETNDIREISAKMKDLFRFIKEKACAKYNWKGSPEKPNKNLDHLIFSRDLVL